MNDTAKEEEYPWLLCKGLKEQLWHFLQDEHFSRIEWYAAELEQSTERLREDRDKEVAARYLAEWEVTLTRGRK